MLNIRIAFLFTLISTTSLFGQNSTEKPVIISLVTKDSVYVKWVPSNFDMFKSVLENGVQVSSGFGSSRNFGNLS